MARSENFQLAYEISKPSFTPAQRDAPALVELIENGVEPVCSHAAAALAVLGDTGRRAIEARMSRANLAEDAHARLVSAVGRFARRGDSAARSALIAALQLPSARVRRAAIGGLGHLCSETDVGEVGDALLARWDASDVTPHERRALTDALGKLGGEQALQRLRAHHPGGDVELARRRDRALLIADRSATRGTASEVRVDQTPTSPLAVRLHCKSGFANLLVDELRAKGIEARANRDDAVDISLMQPWSALFASRLWMSGAIRVARPAGPLASSIVSGIVAQRSFLAAWTHGSIRWRLEVPRGKQRALVWHVAREVSHRAPELVNDPTSTTWDIAVEDAALELRPRRVADPRFAYRSAEVPAASHPTVAAALARLGEARHDDRVWDPFVGSGLELIERAMLGPARSLTGTDLAPTAIAAARTNLEAAGVSASLQIGDARAAKGDRDLDLVITNPPLGSRVKVNAVELLITALPIFARRLASHGRLVWITPATTKTSPVAEQLGFRRRASVPVDLGGMRGHVERWDT